MSITRNATLALLLSLPLPGGQPFSAAQTKQPPTTKPVIDSAVADFQTNQITISGTGLGASKPKVLLDGQSVTVLSFTATTVVGTLPAGIGAGTFVLQLTEGAYVVNFHATLGAVDRKSVV